MKISLIIFNLFLTTGLFAQNNFSVVQIGQIAPTMIETRVYIDSTDTFGTIEVERFYSVIQSDSVAKSKLKNEKLLQLEDWNVIWKILKPTPEELSRVTDREVADCYIPRHVLTFYDENGELIGLIEICFECFAYKTFGICSDWGITILPGSYAELEVVFNRNGL